MINYVTPPLISKQMRDLEEREYNKDEKENMVRGRKARRKTTTRARRTRTRTRRERR